LPNLVTLLESSIHEALGGAQVVAEENIYYSNIVSLAF
jgi:hypothetical protein